MRPGDNRPTMRISRAAKEDKAALAYARGWVRRSPSPDAWANLAAVYATKHPPDLKRARRWCWRAARRGHQRALAEFGLMLINGEGGTPRHRRGLACIRRAAGMGDVNALRVLHSLTARAH